MRVGVDAQAIDEVRDAYAQHGQRYVSRLFTQQEAEASGVDLSTADPASATVAASLAARFAAKEAALKTLGVQDRIPAWTDIEVVRGAGGAVTLRLTGVAKELAEEAGLTDFALSVTHATELAIAVVVAT